MMADYGTVTARGYAVTIEGTNEQLYGWANRSGARWPCSALAMYDRVTATIDRADGDLIDLAVIEDGRDVEAMELTGDELTAWIDDCLSGTPFAHLARTTA